MGWREDWSAVTPMLILAVVAFSWGDLLFGIDTGSFGALQVLPSWLRDFGQYDAATDTYSSPIERRSLMNSIVFVGSFVGCAAFEPICSRFGYKITICIAGVIQIIAVIVELTAKDWVVFTVGRVIAYIAVGIVENASPGYCSEISPAPLRGLMSGSMTVLVTVGNTIGAGVNLPFGNEQRSLGWIIPTSIQFVPAVGILLLVPFCPESPRWLVARGREGDGLKALNRLRGKREVDNGNTALEIEAIKASAEHDRLQEQGRWLDLFNKKYRRRTVIVLGLFFFYQTTGGQFVNVYGPTFYREQLGFDQEVFVYATLGQGVGIAATIIGIIALDWFGRRPPIIFGASTLVVCNILIGSLGAKENITKVEEGVVVASLILLLSGVKISFQCCSFLLTSEMGGNRMRKKFMGFGTSVDVLFRIVFISVIPFLISAPANLGARFGYVMAVFSLAALIFAIFMVPETKGRALEEMDELFAMKIWPWKWSKAQTTGAGRRVAEIESGRDIEKVPEGGVRAFDQRKDTIETQHTEDVADSTATRQPK